MLNPKELLGLKIDIIILTLFLKVEQHFIMIIKIEPSKVKMKTIEKLKEIRFLKELGD